MRFELDIERDEAGNKEWTLTDNWHNDAFTTYSVDSLERLISMLIHKHSEFRKALNILLERAHKSN